MQLQHNQLGWPPEIRVVRKRRSALPIVLMSGFAVLSAADVLVRLFSNSFLRDFFVVELPVFGLQLLLFGWFLWIGTARHLFARDPLLLINHEGIQIGKLPMVAGDELMIRWEEIAHIYVRHFGGHLFFYSSEKP
jgi:hypothetical protein